ncbi:TetR/AcrR family transcriptional regulator [Kitasatospora sp. NPDC057904]|uniref:TetR/AcrR family transcriptional regulator n=1 Tax=unclassified Kitasatospora TaxID=2633591 RepID=UPI0036DDD437
MPKQVDREERRRHIAAALLRIITTRGLEGVSLRDVAAEAGVSMGAVQHYFATKDEMLRFAIEYNHELLTARFARLFAGDRMPTTVRELLRRLLVELLPLDEQSRDGARMGAAILARGAVDPSVRDVVTMVYEGATGFLAQQLRLGQERGELPADLDPDHAARALHTVVEGLRWPVLFGVYREADALAVLDEHLDRLFG